MGTAAATAGPTPNPTGKPTVHPIGWARLVFRPGRPRFGAARSTWRMGQARAMPSPPPIFLQNPRSTTKIHRADHPARSARPAHERGGLDRRSTTLPVQCSKRGNRKPPTPMNRDGPTQPSRSRPPSSHPERGPPSRETQPYPESKARLVLM